MTTTPGASEAMTAERRVQHIRDNYERWGEAALERACGDLFAHIDALTARVAELEQRERELAEMVTAADESRVVQIRLRDAAEARAQAAEAKLETIRRALFPDPEHHITHHARYNLEGALADLEAGQNDPTVRRTLKRVAGQIAAAERALQTKDTTP